MPPVGEGCWGPTHREPGPRGPRLTVAGGSQERLLGVRLKGRVLGPADPPVPSWKKEQLVFYGRKRK